MAQETATVVAAVQELAGKYLTFRLGSEEYGLEIMKVREIIGLMGITEVPRTPQHIRGVINLRGRIIPVLDLRTRFGMEAIEDSEETCIIVVETSSSAGATTMGILVDTVCEVMDIGAEDLEPAPMFGQDVDSRFILGMAKSEHGVKILLNIAHVVSADQLAEMAQLGRAPDAG